MNKVLLIGNVGNKPEIRTLESGVQVVSFSFATNEKYTNKAGEKFEQTEWHRIEAWNNIASAVEKNVQKGDRIFIEGKINTQKWTDKEGIERTTYKIRASLVEFLGFRREQILNENQKVEPETKTKKNSKKGESEKQTSKVVFKDNSGSDDMPF